MNKAAHLGLEFITLNSLYVLFCLFIESIWFLPSETKTLLWIIFSVNTFFLYRGITILIDLLIQKDNKTNEMLLLKIGRQYSEINDKLLNHFQLSTIDNIIAQQSVKDFIASYPHDYFSGAYQPVTIRKKARLATFSLIVLFLFMFSLPGSVFRFTHMKTNYMPKRTYLIECAPQDTSIYSYDTLEITIKKEAPSNFPIEIYREGELILRSMDSILLLSEARIHSNTAYYVKLRRPNLFYARKYPDIDTLKINVLQRPRIESLDISVTSPEYSMIGPAVYQGNMDRIRVLKGSEGTVQIKFSETFGPSWALVGKDTLSLNVNDRSAYLTLVPEYSDMISFFLMDQNGVGTQSTPSYSIDIDKDQYPELHVIEPKMSEEKILTDQLALPYVLHLQDDFGISGLSVHYLSFSEYSFFNDTVYKKIDLPFVKDSRLQTRIGIWEINDYISPGSEVKYYFEISDNDEISGPKKVRSPLFYAKLPTLGDLYESQNHSQDESMAMLENDLISTEEIVKDLEDIRMDLLKEGAMDWEDKSSLEESLNSLEKVQKELQEMQSSLDEQKTFMEENKLFSDEIMQSFEQLQELMNELIDDELFDMLRDMQEKLDRNDTSNMEELLEDFNEKAKRFEESLDRMLEVFKRIQQEQRLEELGQKIKESLKEQQKLLENSNNRNSETLAEEQDRIANTTEQWETLAKESAELFNEADRELYDEFLAKMEEMNVSSSMNAASQDYEQGQKESGQEQSKTSEENLGSLQKSFQQMSSQIMQQQRDKILKAFQRAFRQSLYLSHSHEKALDSGSGLTEGSPLIHAYTSKMMDHLEIAQEINRDLLDLSKMTFLVDKGLGQALGQVIGNLRSGIQNVEEAKLSQGQNNFKLSFKSMNTLSRILLERVNMVMDEQEGNASGMDFYMQQLQQMAGQQQQLNSGMPQLGPDGSPTSSMMDQLAKMAARQQALRRKLKQIQQGMSESGEGNKMSGSLDRIAKDMEDVINQMRKNQVDRQTVMRQEKIVQRLLDASRSATSRDYKKERESKTGKEILRDNPLSLPGDLGDRVSLIDMIRRDVRNSDLTPKEKREMEKYLESLIGQSPEKETK